MGARRIAVLVDGSNVSAKFSDQIMACAQKLGRVDVARVYAAAHHQPDWLDVPGYRFMHVGAGKNSADMLLCVDAMELGLLGGADAFAIATSDGDFTHVAQRLRERGVHVLGLGEAKAPKAFRLACTEFALLQAPQKPAAAAPAPAVGALPALDLNIRAMIARHSQNGRGMRIKELGARMHAVHGTRISTHPDRTWRVYLTGRPALYDLDPRGPEALVRFRPEGFANGRG